MHVLVCGRQNWGVILDDLDEVAKSRVWKICTNTLEFLFVSDLISKFQARCGVSSKETKLEDSAPHKTVM